MENKIKDNLITMTIKDFLDDLIDFKPIGNVSFDKSENPSDLFVIASNMLETSSKHIVLAICYGFGLGVSKNPDLFESELYNSLKFEDYRSYELLIKAYTTGFRIGNDVLKIDVKADKVKELIDKSKPLIVNYHNTKLGYKNLEEIEEIKNLKNSQEERKKAHLEDLNRRKKELLEKNNELTDEEINEGVKYLREEKCASLKYLSDLIRECLKNKKSKSLIRELVYFTLKTINWEMNPDNIDVFPIRELIDHGYNLYALEMLKYCEDEDCTFLNGPKVFILKAECYLNMKDFDKAYSLVCYAQNLLEDDEVYQDFLNKIDEEKQKHKRGF